MTVGAVYRSALVLVVAVIVMLVAIIFCPGRCGHDRRRPSSGELLHALSCVHFDGVDVSLRVHCQVMHPVDLSCVAAYGTRNDNSQFDVNFSVVVDSHSLALPTSV
jgi:hypothetical protein